MLLPKNLCRQGETIILYNDNQSAKVTVNNAHHRCTTHTDVRHHFIREAVERGEVKIESKPTNDKVAVIWTKPLCKAKHMLCTEGLGVKFQRCLSKWEC